MRSALAVLLPATLLYAGAAAVDAPKPAVEIQGDAALLEARQAEPAGKIRLEGDAKGSLTGWSDAADSITWNIAAKKAGRYEVKLIYSCAPGSGGSSIEVACGGSKAAGKAIETGGWADYVGMPLGSLEIPEGKSTVVVRASAKPEKAPAVLQLRGLELEAGFESIFNGKDLTGWRYGEANGAQHGRGYIVEDGLLVCPKDGGGNLFTEKEIANFALRFEFRLYDDSNNGLGIRAPLAGDAAYVGMEIQILNDEWYKKNYPSLQPWQLHGSIYNIVPAKPGFLRPTGEWNIEEVICKGRQVTVNLNGVIIVDANLDEAAAKLDKNTRDRHPGVNNAQGHIGFLGHGTRVDFRNLRLK